MSWTIGCTGLLKYLIAGLREVWSWHKKAGLELLSFDRDLVAEVDVKLLEPCRVKFVLFKGRYGFLKFY